MFQCVNHNVYRSSHSSLFFLDAYMCVSVAYENFIESNWKLLNQDYSAQCNWHVHYAEEVGRRDIVRPAYVTCTGTLIF